MSLQVGRWGRYWGPHPLTGDQTDFVRATTIAKVGDDPNGLITWKAGKALRGAAKRPDLLALVASHEDKVPAKLVDQCAEADEAGAGANYGTALHQTLETIDAGGKPATIPPAIGEQVAAYREAVTGLTFDPADIEYKVANLALGVDVCGTVDRRVGARGRHFTFDIKTTKPSSVPFSLLAWAAQLAIYAFADHRWDDFAEEWRPHQVSRRYGIIAHVPLLPQRKIGGKWVDVDPYCDLITLDLEAGWEEAQRMAGLYRGRKRDFVVSTKRAA